jgi:hypothetical protein
VWIDPSDYGTSIPTDVQNNTANNFRNHPSVFIRRAGGAFTRAVTRRWRDERRIDIAATGSQPIGIAQQSNALVRSKWLVCIDGVASVVYIPHPGGADIRRPKDIWNQVIVPLIHNHSGNASRLVTTDFFGNIVGTETRWEFLSYARYLGDDAATVQDNTPVPG